MLGWLQSGYGGERNRGALVVTSIARTMDAVEFDEETAPAIKFFLTKPVSPDELLARVGSCLSEGDE